MTFRMKYETSTGRNYLENKIEILEKNTIDRIVCRTRCEYIESMKTQKIAFHFWIWNFINI